MDLGDLFRRCIRIFYISRKPTGEEFNKVAKVTALGMVLIGLIGIIISFLFGMIGG
ncbi:MAG: protein translocase SEC61 complex subunit gamma [Candidatus Micrarchaeota archaeon]